MVTVRDLFAAGLIQKVSWRQEIRVPTVDTYGLITPTMPA